MRFNPVKRKTICDEIVDQIKQMIRNGELKPGEKLPGERDLAKLLNVGRSSVREAILVLSSIGLVRKSLEGAFINDKFELSYLDLTYSLLLNESDYAELYEARKLIETITVELAAQKADVEDISSLEEVLGEMSDDSLSVDDFAGLDADFHANIALASRNKVLFEFISRISDLLRSQVAEKITRFKKDNKGINIFQKTFNEHRAVLDAIKNKDTVKAKKLMCEHLNSAESIFIKNKYTF